MAKKVKEEKIIYWDINPILKYEAQYNIIFGERSNGKSYGTLKYFIEQCLKEDCQFAIIRRYQDDFKLGRGDAIFSALNQDGVVKKFSNNEFNQIEYRTGRFYLSRYDIELDKQVRQEAPLGYAFSLSSMEHDKSTSYNRVRYILFDEFISRTPLGLDESTIFFNCISTIKRKRKDVKIFMLGNTINKYHNEYFDVMGLKHVKEMKPDTIDLYTATNENGEELKIAVEYSSSKTKNKAKDIYFCFDNPKLKMLQGSINGEDTWEMAMYPRLPIKYKEDDIILYFFIKLHDYILQCEIVEKDYCSFIYIHKKTSPLQDNYYDLIYSTEFNPKQNYRRCISKPNDDVTSLINNLFIQDKVYYQSNDIGEMVRTFINESEAYNIRNL